MKIAKIIALLGLLAMTGILIYGFTVGDFAAEGSKLLAMPWGIVSLVDLYVGFALFSCWIVFREKSLLPSLSAEFGALKDAATGPFQDWTSREDNDKYAFAGKTSLLLMKECGGLGACRGLAWAQAGRSDRDPGLVVGFRGRAGIEPAHVRCPCRGPQHGRRQEWTGRRCLCRV